MIKIEANGHEVYRGSDREYCAALYDRLTKEWVAECAIKAMEKWLAKDVGERFAKFNEGSLWARGLPVSDQLPR